MFSRRNTSINNIQHTKQLFVALDEKSPISVWVYARDQDICINNAKNQILKDVNWSFLPIRTPNDCRFHTIDIIW